MTRCSYIPPEGESVIAIAKERGGTTDGDIQALIDRFGCKAEAKWAVSAGASGGPWKDPACSDHVGHLLHDGANDVRPIETSRRADTTSVALPSAEALQRLRELKTARQPVRIETTLEGFGTPIILSQSPTAPPVVDLGTNPTREQLEAAGFAVGAGTYAEVLAAFEPMPLPTPHTVGVARREVPQGFDDGRWFPHLPRRRR